MIVIYTMGLYPAVDEAFEKMDTVDGFRLHQISDIKHRIEKDRDLRLGLYKKYRRAVNLQEECNYIVWSPSKMNEELNKNVEYRFIDKNNKEYFYYHLGSSKSNDWPQVLVS